FAKDTVQIPPMPFRPDGAIEQPLRHVVGITARQGFHVSSEDPERFRDGIALAAPAHFAQAWGEPLRGEPATVFEVTIPQPISLKIAPIAPVRIATIRESFTTNTTGLHWEAEAAIECRDVPVAVHRLRIDPRIRLS